MSSRRPPSEPVHRPPLPRLPSALLRALLPHAERDEVLDELAIDHAAIAAARGPAGARRWLWRQLLGSAPALLRRSWWRGWTGFDPRANRMRPGGPVFESWIMDLRYAARRLASRPTYALLAVATLALGAGGTAAIFSVARGLLFEPLPIAREEQVGVLWNPFDWTEEEFLHFRPRFPGFQRVALFRPLDATLDTGDGPLRLVPGVATSAELFDVLGARPLLGRTFQEGEDLPGAEPVTVLSYGLWQELGGEPTILGRTLQLGGVSRTVVGVMPRGFWFPDPRTRVWTTAALDPERRAGMYALVGRGEDGVRLEAMQGPLAAFATALGERFEYSEQWDKTKAPAVTPVRDYLVGDVRPGVIATLAAMGVILLIACANVAALMLGQVDGRATELAVRAALGAGRRRITQQLVIESLLVGTVAGLTGALIAAVGFRLLVDSLPLGALAETATLDWTVFWAAMLLAVLAALVIAVVPSVALWRGELQRSIATMRTGGVGGRGGRLEGGLVVTQMALAVLLAAGAGLLIRSVANLRAIDPGVDVRAVAVLDVTMPTQVGHAARRAAVSELLPSLRALPGVEAAAVAQRLPLRGGGDNWGIEIEGKPELESSTTSFRIVSRDYFDAMGLELRRGRGFTDADREGTELVVVVNEALAARYFDGEDPIGRIIHTGFDSAGERIVGVVANAAEAKLTDAPAPARYMLYEQLSYTPHTQSLVLRTSRPQDAAAVLDAARRVVQREGSQVALQGTTTMQSVFDQAIGPARQVATLLSLLTGLALVLGAVGVYGVISHFVTRRQRDYGIRIALGQPPARVVAQVVRRGGLLVAAGGAIGIAAALLLSRLLASLLYGVGSADPLAMSGAVVVLLAVGLLAAFLPARRASRTDPAVVLREQ